MTSVVAVVTHRPLARWLVALGVVVSVAGLLDLPVVVTTSGPASATPSLTAGVSTPVSDERMGCWGALLPPAEEIVLRLDHVDYLLAIKHLLPTQFSNFEFVLGRRKASDERAIDRLRIDNNTSITH